MRVIAVANRKGGVGKSTVTVNLASALALRELRVLVIDMDSQGSATATLLEENKHPTTAHVLAGHATLTEAVRPSVRPGVDIVPSSRELTHAQLAIVAKTGRETILRRALKKLDGYDAIVIDTAPELQLATVNALVASTHVLMPFTPDPLALVGLETTAEAVREVVSAELSDVTVLGCVQVAHDRRLAVTADARKQVAAAYGSQLFESLIRVNSNFVVCPAWHRDIFDLEKQIRGERKGSADFIALADEVCTRLALLRPAHKAA